MGLPVTNPIYKVKWVLPVTNPIYKVKWGLPVANPIYKVKWGLPVTNPIYKVKWGQFQLHNCILCSLSSSQDLSHLVTN